MRNATQRSSIMTLQKIIGLSARIYTVCADSWQDLMMMKKSKRMGTSLLKSCILSDKFSRPESTLDLYAARDTNIHCRGCDYYFHSNPLRYITSINFTMLKPNMSKNSGNKTKITLSAHNTITPTKKSESSKKRSKSLLSSLKYSG